MIFNRIPNSSIQKMLTDFYTKYKYKGKVEEPVEKAEFVAGETVEEPEFFKDTTENLAIWDKYTSDADRLLQKYGASYNPEMFTNAAKRTYDATGKLIPITFVIAQLQLESGVGKKGKSAYNNPANIYEFTEGTKRTFNSPEESIGAYYNLLANNYLQGKEVEDLLKEDLVVEGASLNPKDGQYYTKNGTKIAVKDLSIVNKGSFVNKQGNPYALNPAYNSTLNKMYQNLNRYLETPVLRKGGKVNKIMDGVLHEERNKIKKITVTRKGVPVISEVCDSKKCEIVQHAEVEKNELVLNKDTTIAIDKLRVEYRKTKDDKVLEKLGLYFANQLLNHTIDSKELILES